MYNSIQPIIHIGYHKTGTSFLQNNLFEHNKKFLRVPQRQIYNNFIYPDPLAYNQNKAVLFADYYLNEAYFLNKIPVFSNERLSGSLHFGGFDSLDIAHRLKSVFKDAKIIICIREQNSMIYSAYSQYIRAVGSASIKEYLDPTTKNNKTLFHRSYLEYHKLIEKYITLFGSKNVLILPYELMLYDIKTYVWEILLFCGLRNLNKDLNNIKLERVNNSLNSVNLLIKRKFNPFIIKGHHNIGNTLYCPFIEVIYKVINNILNKLRLRKINNKIKQKQFNFIKSAIKDYYTESNRITQKLLNHDLKDYGYNI